MTIVMVNNSKLHWILLLLTSNVWKLILESDLIAQVFI